MPVVADRPGNRAGRIGRTHVVGIGDAGRRYGDRLSHLRRDVAERQPAHRFRVAPGRQDDGHIGELQSLDVGQPVGAVGEIQPAASTASTATARDYQVGDRRHAVDRGDVVVGAHVAEDCGVEVDAVGAVEYLPHNDKLAGIVGAVEHQRDQRRHAVVGGDFGSGAVGVGADADPHIEPGVPVDQIVAAAALDQVAAAAAEEDVSRVELVVGGVEDSVGSGAGLTEELPQAVDEVEVRQHAALGAGDANLCGGVIVAAKKIAEVRAGQALRAFEAGK